MAKLSVNVNKVALLRNSRDLDIPNVLHAARTCIEAGAHGITVHPRPDQRHIRRGDVYDLAKLIADRDWQSHEPVRQRQVEFNIEGYPDERYMQIVAEVRPTQATLVPDAPDQRTSDHGWNLSRDAAILAPIVARLKTLGIRVSLFLDPVISQVELAAQLGADRIELYTEPYASAFAAGDYRQVLDQYAAATRKAVSKGLEINAGHDLNLRNLHTFCAIGAIAEVSIGHALIADALDIGLSATVREYLRQLV